MANEEGKWKRKRGAGDRKMANEEGSREMEKEEGGGEQGEGK